MGRVGTAVGAVGQQGPVGMVALVGTGLSRASPGCWRKAEGTTNFAWPKRASKRGKVRKESTLSVACPNKEKTGKS